MRHASAGRLILGSAVLLALVLLSGCRSNKPVANPDGGAYDRGPVRNGPLPSDALTRPGTSALAQQGVAISRSPEAVLALLE